MALKRIVKVGNITNLSDARYCSGMGVDMLGFQVVEGLENHLPAATYQEIKGWIAGPKVVVELYGIKDPTAFQKILEDYQPDLLEFGPAELAYLPPDVALPVIYSGAPDETTRHLRIEFMIHDQVMEQANIPVLINCEDEAQLKTILTDPTIEGVVLKGSPEERPGQQNYDHLADILEALEEE